MTLTTVDAFASGPFSGNPAAVCVLDGPAADAWMQALAGEMNLSETAFVRPRDGGFGLRWFTPTTEVDLCGHATLAAAHVLFEDEHVAADAEAEFDTRSGRLVVRRIDGGAYTMDFPATPPTDVPAPEGLAEVLGRRPVWVGKSTFDWLVELESESAVRSLDPEPAAVTALGMRGLIVTSRADGGQAYEVVSRFFAPGAGVAEDPVTGSAHCAIGPYWADKLSTDRIACYQASARGGDVDVQVLGDRVSLTGRAVTVYRADLAAAARPDAFAS